MNILACTTCGSPAMAIRPGTLDQTCELFGTVLVLKRGVPAQLFCLEHWPASWVSVPETEGQVAKHFQPKEL